MTSQNYKEGRIGGECSMNEGKCIQNIGKKIKDRDH
jgi:hypothetical protein